MPRDSYQPEALSRAVDRPDERIVAHARPAVLSTTGFVRGGYAMERAALLTVVLEVLRQNPELQVELIPREVQERARDYIWNTDEAHLGEIIWRLLVEGVLSPGQEGSATLDFRFVHATEYGKQCLEAGAILPYDPEGFIAELQKLVGDQLDDIVLTYLRESLQTFCDGHHLASAVMLGGASERCVDLLAEAIPNALVTEPEKLSFQKRISEAERSAKRRFDIILEYLGNAGLPKAQKDALDTQLSGIFILIRYSRNDAGHPTGQTISRDEAFANLRLFRQYCRRVYSLIEYLRTSEE